VKGTPALAAEVPAQALAARLEAVPLHLLISNKQNAIARMFCRQIRVEYEADGQRHPVPLKWLDSFAMRNFTNAPIFDDTLPVADGMIEIGNRVPLPELKSAMEDWFRRKGYLPKNAALLIAELEA
jgi:hypothetical protein